MHTARVLLLFALAGALAAAPAGAEVIGGNPGPQYNYVCPHADGMPPIDCYLDAVKHLYTMCRNVKAIEIIEYGYEKSTDGTNGAKSESCFDKQKQNISRPFKEALREMRKRKPVLEELRKLQEAWLAALAHLKWESGESDAAYKARVAKPYDEFDATITTIRTSLAAPETAPAKPAKSASSKQHAKTASH